MEVSRVQGGRTQWHPRAKVGWPGFEDKSIRGLSGAGRQQTTPCACFSSGLVKASMSAVQSGRPALPGAPRSYGTRHRDVGWMPC